MLSEQMPIFIITISTKFPIEMQPMKANTEQLKLQKNILEMMFISMAMMF